MACRVKMAMNVYWSWEKEWVKDMQIHSQRVTIWQWLKILDLMYHSNPVPRFSASLDSRGVYVLNAPTWRTWSMRMDRTWVLTTRIPVLTLFKILMILNCLKQMIQEVM